MQLEHEGPRHADGAFSGAEMGAEEVVDVPDGEAGYEDGWSGISVWMRAFGGGM